MVVDPDSAAVCTFTVPYPRMRPHIVCVHRMLLILSSGLSSARTDSTPDSSITRSEVTAHRSERQSSQRQSDHSPETASATPATGAT